MTGITFRVVRGAFGVLLACCAVGGVRAGSADPSATKADKPSSGKPKVTKVDVFQAGADGYKCYRIPSLLLAPNGDVLAFAEARKKSCSDTGNIDLVYKISKDQGKTWGKMQVLWDDADNTCGNPCPVVDEKTGIIWMLMTHNLGTDSERRIKSWAAKGTRTVWVSRSDDNGQSWSKPVDITKQTKKSGWGWYATGPGVGIQLQHGVHKGRLVIPCDHSYDDDEMVRGTGKGSHVIYSDDRGETWKIGGAIRPLVNECQCVELADGRGSVMMNMRWYAGQKCRAVATSNNAGEAFTNPTADKLLPEPICQASFFRYAFPEKVAPVSTNNNRGRLLFSNPASTKRQNMTLRLSGDDGATWPIKLVLEPGPSAYSCVAKFKDGNVGCLYETGAKRPYEKITLAIVPKSWATQPINDEASDDK